MSDAMLHALPARRLSLRRRILEGGGFWPAVPALVYLAVFLVAPIVTLLGFGFVTLDRGQVADGSFTLAHMTGVLSDPLVWRLTWRSFWVAAITPRWPCRSMNRPSWCWTGRAARRWRRCFWAAAFC